MLRFSFFNRLYSLSNDYLVLFFIQLITMYFYYNKASSHKMLNHYNFPDIYQPKNNCCYYKCSPVYSYKHLLSKYIFGFLKHQIKTAVHKNGLRFYLVSFYSHSISQNVYLQFTLFYTIFLNHTI